jgi:nondiscriminating glutamyl-tRNA synthetase
LYNELFARNQGGGFVLRVEDTDRTRTVEGGVDNIIRTLEWAGIVPDEGPMHGKDGKIIQVGDMGPYIQSERTETYAEHVRTLLGNGSAYRCFCTPEQLEEMKAQQESAGARTMYDGRCRALSAEESAGKAEEGTAHVVRLAVPRTGQTVFVDAIRGEVSFANELIDDQVLMKSDGFPTYHLANVVDDHLMGITHVIRGEEWLPSTPKHLLLYKAFGWDAPTFAHMPLLLNADRSKLSKRQGDVAAEDYKNKGYLPEALVNFVALLGWNPSGDREVYSKDELIAAFDLGKVNKGGAVFNIEKLDWMNREYLKSLDIGLIVTRAVPFFIEKDVLRQEGDTLVSVASGDVISQDFLFRAVSLERGRVNTLAELPAATAYFFSRGAPLEEGVTIHWKKSTPEEAKERLTALIALYEGLDAGAFNDLAALEKATFDLIAERGWKNGDTLWPLRVALTGRSGSPTPFEVAWALGKELSLARMRDAVTALQ